MKNTVNTNNTGRGGNTSTPLPRNIRARKWCMTWNNYTIEDFNKLEEEFIKRNYVYIIGKEIGTENTPHLQIYFSSKNPIAFNTLKKRYPHCHIEKAKGNEKSNLKYCSKEGNYSTNQKILISKEDYQKKMDEIILLEEYNNDVVKFRDWQLEIMNILNNPVDKRKIYWYWEDKGNVGKTWLGKYIDLKYDVIIADGKSENIFNQVKIFIDEQKYLNSRIVILDIPRSSYRYTNYGAIEKLKDGWLYSGKYEGGKCRIPKPHIIIFANKEPDYEEMSLDRWIVKKI